MMTRNSVLFPPDLIKRARRNADRFAWAAEIRDAVIERAEPWLGLSWDELWESVFGPGITRSWMVWSDGHCPSCARPVTMYNWKVAPFDRPWKVTCPHCSDVFPKNDFEAYYRSGLDRAGLFRPDQADRSLLVNPESNNDSGTGFGVDDGEGFVDGEHRWRFIGAWLVYGQWKGRVLAGIDALSAAWLVSGNIEYARRTALLLDRVADFYPMFDFAEQGLVYEERPRSGYVTNWHDACAETRLLVEAYDRVAPAFEDEPLIGYLGERAARHGLDNPKDSADAVRRNIEDRILRDALANRDKIYSNFPNEEQTCLVIEMVLGWPEKKSRVMELLEAILVEATAVDGMSGEKGLMAYATIGPRGMVQILGQFARLDPTLLGEILQRHPRVRDQFRFHIDTWCLHRFYPKEGDGGGFNQDRAEYFTMLFDKRGLLEPGVEPSPFTFLGELFRQTGDPAFAQVLYRGNGGTVKDLPHDLFAEDPEPFQARIAEVIAVHGDLPRVESIHFSEWHLAILRSGEGDRSRALWIDYDTMGRHCHADAMNFGLFAHGMDLLPDFGYPPVQYGGWFSPRAEWYKSSAAHNTVVVDGLNTKEGEGSVDFWVNRGAMQAVRVSAPDLTAAHRFERSLAMIDVSPDDFYVIDLFRVRGGSDHTWLLHGYKGTIRSEGLALQAAPEFGHGAQMRNFNGDPLAGAGWMVEWEMDSDSSDLERPADVRLRCHGFTSGAAVHLAESWVSLGYGKDNRDLWIPQLLVRRSGASDLESNFVTVLETHTGEPTIRGIRRLSLVGPNGEPTGDSSVALEVTLCDGQCDLLVQVDAASGHGELRQVDWGVFVEAELCWMRRRPDGTLSNLTVVEGRVSFEGQVVESEPSGFVVREYSR